MMTMWTIGLSIITAVWNRHCRSSGSVSRLSSFVVRKLICLSDTSLAWSYRNNACYVGHVKLVRDKDEDENDDDANVIIAVNAGALTGDTQCDDNDVITDAPLHCFTEKY